MLTVTDLGDLAVLMPLMGVMLVLLCLGGRFPLGWRWMAVVVACAVTIAGLKATFCGGAYPPFRTPSGHTGMSTVVYGGLGLIMARDQPRPSQVVLALAAASVIAAIGFSRVFLGYHTSPDTVLGLAIGLTFLGLFWRWTSRLQVQPLDWKLDAVMILILLLIVSTFHGAHIGSARLEACRF